MNRTDLHKLTNARIREASILFEAGEYSGAYYLAGYAVECALKACFAKTVKRYDFPDRSGAGKIFTHRLQDLTKLAGVDGDLSADQQANSSFRAYWIIVFEWTEESRYVLKTREQAAEWLSAITSKKDGVLTWIKRRW